MFIIDLLIKLLILAIIIRVVLSWLNYNPGHEFTLWLEKITDPILRPFKQLLNPYQIGVDISPVFAILALGLIRKLLFWALG